MSEYIVKRNPGLIERKVIEKMRQEIEQIPDHTMISERSIQVFTAERIKKEVLKVFDKYTKEMRDAE